MTARAVPSLAALLACAGALVLVACGSGPTVKRDLQVEGTLPRAIGLGAFASSCLLFCYVRNDIRQGDVIREDDDLSTLRVHRGEVDNFSGKPDKAAPQTLPK